MAGKRGSPLNAVELESKIRVRAYERWRGLGMPSGTALDDWLVAEAELLATPVARKRVGTTRKKAGSKV
ncbi:MAG: DUF2934 domain-containing protein [bacterium]